VITDSNGALAETLDYYPYGAARVDNRVGSYLGEKRKFASTEHDDGTGLDYMQARYYNSTRGAFISEDPIHLALGDANQFKQLINQSQESYLSDPQQLNSYSYARSNPLKFSDPTGLWYKEFVWDNIRTFGNGQSWSDFQIELGQATRQLTQDSSVWNFAVNHPYTSGTAAGVFSASAAQAGLYGLVAIKSAVYPGVGLAYAATHIAEGAGYLYLAQGSLRNISDILTQLSNFNGNNPSLSSSASLMFRIAVDSASTVGGEKVGGVVDTYSVISSVLKGISTQLTKIRDSINTESENDKEKK
jgi:RHS repeat-associated protein